MNIYNPGLTAANEVLKRAKAAGVADEHLRICLTMENAGNSPSIAERVKIVDRLEADQSRNKGI